MRSRWRPGWPRTPPGTSLLSPAIATKRTARKSPGTYRFGQWIEPYAKRSLAEGLLIVYMGGVPSTLAEIAAQGGWEADNDV